jgi:hypothetical protein
MEIIPGNGFLGGVVLLSEQTGLVDVPTLTDNGCRAQALLNPEIRPNRRVKIVSRVLEMNSRNSEYRVSECIYTGDNREGDMVVIITGEAVNGEDTVDEGIK